MHILFSGYFRVVKPVDDNLITSIMDSSNVLTTVCVLVAMVGHVISQSCFQETTCIRKLDIYDSLIPILHHLNLSPFDYDLEKLCRKTFDVTQCYRDLSDCPKFASITTALPGANQVQTALDSICRNEDEIQFCLRSYIFLSDEIEACDVHLKAIFFPGILAVSRDSASRRMVQYTNCIVDSFNRCGNPLAQRMESIGKQFLTPTTSPPARTPDVSGCLRLESWPFLGVIATLTSSAIQML